MKLNPTFNLAVEAVDGETTSFRSFRSIGSVTMGEIGWTVTVLVLLLGYFTPVSFSTMVLVAWLSVLALFSLVKVAREIPKAFYLLQWLCVGLLCMAALLLNVFNEYGGGYALRVLIPVAGIYLLVGVLDEKPPKCAESLFYGVSTVGLALLLAIWAAQPTFYAHMGGVDKSGDLAPLLYGALDKNWTALFVFLYFAYSIKGGKRLGVCLGLAYPLAYLGRQYLMMLAFLLIAVFLLRVRGGRLEHGIGSVLKHPFALLALFVVGGVGIAVLSYVWVNYVIPTGLVAYKTGLNDGSNAMRMSSINYVLSRIANDVAFLYRGFDQSIFDVLGINTEEMGYGDTYYVMGLYRLVQPHNEVINMLAKEGLLFSLLYYGAVSNVLSRLIESKLDVAVLISFMLGCLFLHQMFTCQTLMLLVFVLASAEKPKRRTGRGKLSTLS